jgi:hypothetical protein
MSVEIDRSSRNRRPQYLDTGAMTLTIARLATHVLKAARVAFGVVGAVTTVVMPMASHSGVRARK